MSSIRIVLTGGIEAITGEVIWSGTRDAVTFDESAIRGGAVLDVETLTSRVRYPLLRNSKIQRSANSPVRLTRVAFLRGTNATGNTSVGVEEGSFGYGPPFEDDIGEFFLEANGLITMVRHVIQRTVSLIVPE